MRAATLRIARGGRVWFSIGFVPSTLYGVLPEVIRRFRAAEPSVEVGLSELTTLQQLEALKAGRIDVGFGRLRLPQRAQLPTLCRLPISAPAPPLQTSDAELERVEQTSAMQMRELPEKSQC